MGPIAMTDETRLVLVPAEPTEDMIEAGLDKAAWARRNELNRCEQAAHQYRAMIAAAPPPQQGDMRERVARLIDPAAFADPPVYVTPSYQQDIAGTKAVRILSLIQPAPAIDRGDSDEAYWTAGNTSPAPGFISDASSHAKSGEVADVRENRTTDTADVQALVSQVEKLKAAVQKAAGWFDEYEGMHATQRAADLRSALSGEGV